MMKDELSGVIFKEFLDLHPKMCWSIKNSDKAKKRVRVLRNVKSDSE